MAMEAEQREAIAERIRQLRGRVPQREIADRVGVTERAYQAWEAGGGIAWDNLQALANALGVSDEYLIYGDAGDQARLGTQLERVEARIVRVEALLEEIYEATVTGAPSRGEHPGDHVAQELEAAAEEHAPPPAHSARGARARRAADRRR